MIPTNEMLVDLANASLREAMNAAGDNAWFLRKTVELTVNAPPATTTMPPEVKRLYQLEHSAFPGTFIQWTKIKHDDSGNMVIEAECGAPVIAHYRTIEGELVNPLDETAFPWQHEELIVTMILCRLAQSFGNPQLLALLTERKAQLMTAFKRDCLFYETQRFEPMSSSLSSRESWALRMGRW